MARYESFKLRVNTTELELITAVARQLDRTESDTMRLLVREKARQLGLMPLAPKDDRHVAQAT